MKNKIISRALAMILAGTLVLLTPVTTSTVFAKENTTSGKKKDIANAYVKKHLP